MSFQSFKPLYKNLKKKPWLTILIIILIGVYIRFTLDDTIYKWIAAYPLGYIFEIVCVNTSHPQT